MPGYLTDQHPLSPEYLRQLVLHPYWSAFPYLLAFAIWIAGSIVLDRRIKHHILPGGELDYRYSRFPWNVHLLDRTGKRLWWFQLFASAALLGYLVSAIPYVPAAVTCHKVYVESVAEQSARVASIKRQEAAMREQEAKFPVLKAIQTRKSLTSTELRNALANAPLPKLTLDNGFIDAVLRDLEIDRQLSRCGLSTPRGRIPDAVSSS